MTERLTDEALLPCPFCGGEAERLDIDEGENAGGSCICCKECMACGNVEFGFKENFVSNWNRRATPADDLRAAAIGPRAAYMTCRGCPAHRKTDWSEPSGDGETMDRGIVNNCGAADGRCIDGSYGSISPMPPVWCPAALSQNGGA